MCYLTKALLKKIPLPLKHQTLHWAAQFEHRMQAGSKPIFHIEAYLARFMSIAKQASTGGPPLSTAARSPTLLMGEKCARLTLV